MSAAMARLVEVGTDDAALVERIRNGERVTVGEVRRSLGVPPDAFLALFAASYFKLTGMTIEYRGPLQ